MAFALLPEKIPPPLAKRSKKLCGCCMEGAVIVPACIIFSAFAASGVPGHRSGGVGCDAGMDLCGGGYL